MFRLDKNILWISLVSAYVLIFIATSAFAHSGHTHEEKLRIALPDVVAKVNGEDLRNEDIVRELKQALTNYKKRGMPLTADQEKSAAKKLIDNEIGRALLLQKGKGIGAHVTNEMLERKLRQIKSSFKSDAVFEHELKDRKMTIEQYRKELKIDLQMQQVIEREIAPSIKISEDEIKAYYEKMKDRFRMGPQARASVILIKAKRGNAESEKSAQKKIENILHQINNGADFGELATKFSQDSLASKGGDLGYFTKNQMFGAFSTRAFDMKVGDVSEAFKTGLGFHLLKLTDLKAGETISLDKAREQIDKTLRATKIGSATRSYVETLKEKADIKMYF